MNRKLAEVRPEQVSVEELLVALATDRDAGLEAGEARARLAQYGANRLPFAQRAPWWRQFLAQFESALVIMLLFATLISFAI